MKKILAITLIMGLSILIVSISLLLDLLQMTNETDKDLAELPITDSLFRVIVPKDELVIDINKETVQYSGAIFELKPELIDVYEAIRFSETQRTVVVYPIFTETAYSDNGFYAYYRKECDSTCLTVSIKHGFNGEYSSSRAAFNSFKVLDYPYITDIDIDKEPEILEQYDKVILLHNEYVTHKEFVAITKHPKVIYLYPNSLFAEVEVNYDADTIRLVKGHYYPEPTIQNGFDWELDNSELEYDNVCENWEFYQVTNGYMLSCYPEYVIFKDKSLLKMIKDL